MKRKARHGVLVTIANSGDDVIVSLEDATGMTGSTVWRIENPYTEQKYSRKNVETMSLSKKQLEDLGGDIVARLNAFLGLGRN